MEIIRYGNQDTVNFAGTELKQYLEQISGKQIDLKKEEEVNQENKTSSRVIKLGLTSNFSINKAEATNESLDDYIYIKIDSDQGGIISGSNPRSVLLAVYRYLNSLGCRWVRPGSDGEIIPDNNKILKNVEIRESPDYRHRGICIEGAVSKEHVMNIIDWAPKAGFNSYFIQFREGYTFFERWYEHKNNPELEAEACSREKVREYVDQIVAEIKKRDMIYHAVGHGWTCEPLGIPGLGWQQEEQEVPADVSQYLAQVDGKRELDNGIPLNTNLCYSQPEVRKMVIEEIADYLEDNPEIDFLHFWLADGTNNHCECEECRQKRPSDFYVMMLNELDQLLEKRGIATKIVFLIYVDLLWPPQEEKIENPDRFIMMFAPITRTYREAFIPEKDLPELPDYDRNNLDFPESISGNISFLKAWQQVFGGDSFDFDYHFMWDHYFDPGYMNISRVLSEDIKNLEKIGLNGFMSCQTQRSFLPTGLGMVTMGWSLWDSSMEFENISQDYFRSAFGGDWEIVQEYLTDLSAAFVQLFSKKEKKEINKKDLPVLKEIQKDIAGFRPVIEKNVKETSGNQEKSWRYLNFHAYLIYGLVQALTEKANNKQEQAQIEWERTKTLAQYYEEKVDTVFDVYLFIDTLSPIFEKETDN